MNTIFKRSVAGILTASMLLTGLTACFKSPEERQEASLLSAFNKDTDIEFDKILLSSISRKNGNYGIYITGYKVPATDEQLEDELDAFKDAYYIITEEEFNQYKDLNERYDAYYPFSNEMTEFLTGIVNKYDPEYVEDIYINAEGEAKLNELVEEYCK